MTNGVSLMILAFIIYRNSIVGHGNYPCVNIRTMLHVPGQCRNGAGENNDDSKYDRQGAVKRPKGREYSVKTIHMDKLPSQSSGRIDLNQV